MKHVYLLLIVLVMATTAYGQAGKRPLPRSTPEAQGVSSDKLLTLITTLDEQIEGMHSVMVVRHGQVIVEGWWKPYDAEHNHVLYSLSKSFTSTAVGLAVHEGKLSIDDVVMEHFPEDRPPTVDDNLKAMRVRDLLTMTTGHQDEPSAAAETVSAKTFLAQPVPHLPGTHFKYNTAATFMQSALVHKVTGQSTLDYLRPRLFEPLGIEHPVWDANFQGISLGGYGLRVRTEDIAKLGQLYLQRGNWEGKQLIPATWTDMATSKQVSNGSNPDSDWNQGYGFQFWRCRHNAFRGDGAFGQYCVVMPDVDTVVAITSGVNDMQAVLNVLWDKLLPALETDALPANERATKQLHEKLHDLTIAAVQGEPTSPQANALLNQRFALDENELQLQSMILSSTDDGQSITLEFERAEAPLTFPAGYQQWRSGQTALPAGRLAQFVNEPVAGTFAWTSPDTMTIKVCAVETPFHQTYTLKLTGETVTIKAQANVGFGATTRGPWIGRRNTKEGVE